MKSVLISIQPRWCELIASGEKTIEVRKTRPKIDTPFKCYIYMTAGDASYPVTINGAPYTCHNNGGMGIIGEFICDCVYDTNTILSDGIDDKITMHDFREMSCLSGLELNAYSKGAFLYGWHISDLKFYPYGKSIRDFSKVGYDEIVPLRRPPQSWMYVESEETK